MADQQSDGRVAVGPGISAVVGVGASAGGLEALEQMLSNVPVDSGMAVIVVTHLHPTHKSLLSELLAKHTKLPVVAADEDMEIEANHVYIGQPGSQLSVQGGKLIRQEPSKAHAPKMPINYFLRSLASDQKERAIAVILSGTGSDGTLGLQEIKAHGGMVMAESPEQAMYPGMPESAIATGLVDFIAAPAELPGRLVQYLNGLEPEDEDAVAQTLAEGPAEEIFESLRAHTGHDFSAYKRNTVQRRIARRMNVHQITTHAQYGRYLRENPDEIDVLFRELLINVTNFFRDPEAWEGLQAHIEQLLASRPHGHILRVWVPGCSSGEEVYSIAILLQESLEASKRKLDVQIFGTDLDAKAVETARSGLYAEDIANDLTPERLKKYFTVDERGYRISKSIREMVIFAQQNVIKDPPFTQVDILSCRNMLIYLTTAVQKKLLPIFHYALRPGGLLFLGSSENVGSLNELFVELDKRWKVFRRTEVEPGRTALPEFPIASFRNRVANAPPAAERSDRQVNIQRQIERILLRRFVPASVIVNPRGDIVYVHGRTGDYLEPSEGQPRNNILEMAREGLQLELAEAMRRCGEQDDDIEIKSLRIERNRGEAFVDLAVAKLEQPDSLRDLLLISFRPSIPVAETAPSAAPTQARHTQHIEQLERALRFLRESHQATIEELETSNEELQSTNEELQSTNEELQSANEELETSKEEMQSLNEELTTVNAELQTNVEDLSQSSDDMQNLLNSTKIATVFLDNDLKIKRFTEQARELVMLRASDVGRPISELTSNLQHEDLSEDCRQVLNTLVFKETEVESGKGAIYMMRIMPYRTARNAIEGLVLTFVDITRLKLAQRNLRHMSEVFQEGKEPIIIVDLQGNIMDLNDQALTVYGYSREEVIGNPVIRLVPRQEQDKTEELLIRCRDGEAIRNEPWTVLTRAGDEARVVLTLSVLTKESGAVDAIAMGVRTSDRSQSDAKS